jgi:hypothetical protein
MKPSRTYAIAIFGILAQLLIALATVVIALVEPAALPSAAEVLGLLAMSLGGTAAAGSGSMAARDYASGGLTSSQGHEIMAHQAGE